MVCKIIQDTKPGNRSREKELVKVEKYPVKPSKVVKVGDVISIKLGPLEKVVRVEDLDSKKNLCLSR